MWYNSTSGTNIFLGAGPSLGCSGNMFVAAVGSTASQATGILAYSYDGINWTQSVQGSALLASFGNYVGVKSFTWNGATWIGALGSNSTFGLIYSPDGINWSQGNASYNVQRIASRRPLPYIGTNIQGNFQAAPTGPTGAGSPSSYFLNTANANLYRYQGTGWTGISGLNNYTPAVSGNWTGTAPTTIAGALDRLAAGLVALNIYP